MRNRKDTKKIALLFLLPLLALAALLVRKVVDSAVRERSTQALVHYVQVNSCEDSSEHCYSSEIDWLIENGADVNARMPSSEPIMRWCAKHGALDIAQHLKRAGAQPGAETQRIIWRTYKKNLNDNLLEAAAMDELPDVQKAMSAGADVNYKDENGDTPLTKAIESQNAAVVKLLLAKGANIRARHNGMSLLSFALRHGGEPQTLSLLKAAGAPTSPTIKLFIAVIQNRPNEVRKWLHEGLNVNTTNNGARDGWTPLMWAASYGHTNMVQLLLQYGADPHIKDGEGQTALSCAYRFAEAGDRRTRTVEVLESALSQRRTPDQVH